MFLLATLGFSALYFIHEVATPDVAIDDTLIELSLVAVCLLIGFYVPGRFAEWYLTREIHRLKEIDLGSDEKIVLDRFQKLFSYTESYRFLPHQVEWFRNRLIHYYADYLMSIGRDDLDAMRAYLKAFLHDPQGSKFRAPLLAILKREQDLESEEIDLLLVMLKVENRKDDELIHLLAGVFLKKQEFTLRSEPVFLEALESEGDDVERIIQLVVPYLLKKERSDLPALRFYLRALQYYSPFQEEIKRIVGTVYYEGRWKSADIDLHEHCGKVYASLDKGRQDIIARAVDEIKASGRPQKTKLFSREDRFSLSKLRSSMKIGVSNDGFAKNILSWLSGAQGVRFIIVGATISLALVFGEPTLKYFKEKMDALHPLPPVEKAPHPPIEEAVMDKSKVYTVQVAAVFSKGHANKIVNTVKESGVIEKIHVVESKRSSGGSWYKIRVGDFPKKEEAQRFADDLMERKIIKNYFILSVPKSSSRASEQ